MKPVWHASSLVLLLAVVVGAADYFVSPTGSDAWSGTLSAPNAARTDGPFATLRRARDAVRGKVKAGLTEPVTVCLRAGTHSVSETLLLGEDCSGTKECPVVFEAYRGEHPVVVGARAITGWQPHRHGIMKANLQETGFKQLFFADKRQILARYPNFDPANPITGGWAYVAKEAPPGEAVETAGAKRVLQVRKEDVRRWSAPIQAQVSIFPSHEWWNNIVPVAEVSADGATLTLTRNCSYEIKPEDRYYVMGPVEELDAPGEWAVDAKGGTLYFLPPEPLADKPVYAPTVRTILQIESASNVTVRGLTFQYCDGTAVQVKDSEDCLIAGCTIRNVGDYNGSGVQVAGGARNGVVGCDISDVGNSGITLSGGDQKTLTPAGNYAENNHITRTGVFYKQGSGITVSGVGNRVSRNTIHHVPRFAVQFGGNRNVIELNELHHTSLETSDTGAIYGGSLGWISGHGTIIRHNYVHDMVGCGRRNGEWRTGFYSWGIYLDWTPMGMTVEGNIIARSPRAGIMVHDGRHNRILNNIVVDCGGGLYDTGSQIEASGWHTEHFFWKRGLTFKWVEKYQSVANLPAWNQEGSTLCDPMNTALPDGRTMHSNRFERNILCYRSPNPQAFRFRNVSLEHNPSDWNLVWHYGEPVSTGLFRVESAIGGDLAPNGGFEEGEVGTPPSRWRFRLPLKQSRAELTADPVHSGKTALHLLAVDSPEFEGKPGWLRQVMAESEFIPAVKAGQHYRASVWLRAREAKTAVRLEALSYKGGEYDVRFSKEALIGPEWTQHEVVFQFPKEGDGNYHAGMNQTFYLRVILRQDEGEVWMDDMSLQAVKPMPEWEAWQAAGQDPHSVIADPLFVDPTKDDYRLKPESPAWRLGFKRIPVEKIGCYDNPLRASWPLNQNAE
jgi:hypothetical protein